MFVLICTLSIAKSKKESPASGCSSWPFAKALRIMVFLPQWTIQSWQDDSPGAGLPNNDFCGWSQTAGLRLPTLQKNSHVTIFLSMKLTTFWSNHKINYVNSLGCLDVWYPSQIHSPCLEQRSSTRSRGPWAPRPCLAAPGGCPFSPGFGEVDMGDETTQKMMFHDTVLSNAFMILDEVFKKCWVIVSKTRKSWYSLIIWGWNSMTYTVFWTSKKHNLYCTVFPKSSVVWIFAIDAPTQKWKGTYSKKRNQMFNPIFLGGKS